MSKHTPGPWKLHGSVDDSRNYAISKPNGDDYEWQEFATVYNHLGFKEQSKANAKLIAAAPDLLEACQWALHSFELLGYEGSDNSTIGKLKDAIQKATL